MFLQVPMGGQVPKKYYKTQLSCVDLTQFTKVTVGRGSSLELEYIVEKAGSVIRFVCLLYVCLSSTADVE